MSTRQVKDMASKRLDIERLHGNGDPVIFIHGWLGSKDSWEKVREELELENPLIFYDQRCHGDSLCSNFKIEDLAEDLGEIISGLDQEPFIVGHSMGGMTALQYATENDNYKGLVLLGTCASTPRPKYRSPKFFLEKLGELARETWAEMIADNYAEDSPKVREGAVHELKNAGKNPVVYGLKAMIDYDVRDKLEDETALVIAGEKDSAITVKQCRELSELLESDLEVVESSHLMLQEAPEKVASKVEDFLESKNQ